MSTFSRTIKGLLRTPRRWWSLFRLLFGSDIARHLAASDLREMKDPWSVWILLRLLDDDDHDVAADAAAALAEMHEPRAREAFLRVVHTHTSPTVRRYAIRGLSAARDPTLLPVLCKTLLRDRDGDNRREAYRALEDLPVPQSGPAKERIVWMLVQGRSSEIAALGTKTIPAIREVVLKNENFPGIAKTAIDALCKIGDKCAVDALFELTTTQAKFCYRTDIGIALLKILKGSRRVDQCLAFFVHDLTAIVGFDELTKRDHWPFLKNAIQRATPAFVAPYVKAIREELEQLDASPFRTRRASGEYETEEPSEEFKHAHHVVEGLLRNVGNLLPPPVLREMLKIPGRVYRYEVSGFDHYSVLNTEEITDRARAELASRQETEGQ